jgi:hypothetical protein
MLSRRTRGSITAERKKRVNVDEIEPAYVRRKPPRESKRDLVGKNIPPKKDMLHASVLECLTKRNAQSPPSAIIIRRRYDNVDALFLRCTRKRLQRIRRPAMLL